MPEYKCKKCGATAHSKCAASRTIFPTDQNEAVFSHFLTIEHDPPAVKIVMPISEGEDAERAIKSIKYFLDATPAKQIACLHRYIMKADQCELGCCKK